MVHLGNGITDKKKKLVRPEKNLLKLNLEKPTKDEGCRRLEED